MDLHNNLEVRTGVVAALNNDDAVVSAIIDRANREGLEFLIATNTLADADATFAVKVEDSDLPAMGDAAEVDDAYLLGTEAGAAFKFDDDNEVRKIGYIGLKRYVRLTVTPTNNAGAGVIAIMALLGGARVLPHSSQG